MCDVLQGRDESYFIKKSHVTCMRLFYEVSLRRILATYNVSHASGTRILRPEHSIFFLQKAAFKCIKAVFFFPAGLLFFLIGRRPFSFGSGGVGGRKRMRERVVEKRASGRKLGGRKRRRRSVSFRLHLHLLLLLLGQKKNNGQFSPH